MMKEGVRNDRGAVSLFVVVFTALLITTITVTFVNLMVQNQQQATTDDLSRSALDSAFAGVEDAKRAIVSYRSLCQDTGATGTAECVALQRALTGGRCDTIQQAGIAGSVDDKEVIIKQNEGDETLQQAYTCVKVAMDTDDFVGSVTPNTSRLIPLRASANFDRITLEWYSQEDLQNAENNGVNGVNLGLDAKLPKAADWPKNRPALMRVQLIQHGNTFNLSDFKDDEDGKSNNSTLFLVPSRVGRDTVSFSDDARLSHTSDSLQQIRCDPTFSASSAVGQYACKTTIILPLPIGANDSANRHAYIRVSEIYNPNTSFRVSLADGATGVQFRGVQPLVDSTGRANDLFRRIRSRVEMGGNNLIPLESALDITGSLCKTFLITDREQDYQPGSCQDN